MAAALSPASLGAACRGVKSPAAGLRARALNLKEKKYQVPLTKGVFSLVC